MILQEAICNMIKLLPPTMIVIRGSKDVGSNWNEKSGDFLRPQSQHAFLPFFVAFYFLLCLFAFLAVIINSTSHTAGLVGVGIRTDSGSKPGMRRKGVKLGAREAGNQQSDR